MDSNDDIMASGQRISRKRPKLNNKAVIVSKLEESDDEVVIKEQAGHLESESSQARKPASTIKQKQILLKNFNESTGKNKNIMAGPYSSADSRKSPVNKSKRSIISASLSANHLEKIQEGPDSAERDDVTQEQLN